MQESQKNLERFQKDIEYFQMHQEELLHQYPDQWVAIFNEKIVGASPDAEKLLSDLKKRGVPLGHALVKYVTQKEELLILSA